MLCLHLHVMSLSSMAFFLFLMKLAKVNKKIMIIIESIINRAPTIHLYSYKFKTLTYKMKRYYFQS